MRAWVAAVMQLRRVVATTTAAAARTLVVVVQAAATPRTQHTHLEMGVALRHRVRVRAAHHVMEVARQGIDDVLAATRDKAVCSVCVRGAR